MTVTRVLAFVFGALAIGSQDVGAEAQAVLDNGFRVENRVEVNATPGTVWAALVADVDAWWPRDHSWWGEASRFSIDARAGGCLCERLGDCCA